MLYKIYNYNENPFQWLTLGPTAVVALLGLFGIIFLFPEWKRNLLLAIFLLLSIIIISGGVFSFFFGILHARKVNWQIVSGVIVSSHVQKESDRQSTVDDRYLSGTRTVTYYVPYVVCKYNVLGKEFTSAMIAGPGTNGSDEAQTVLGQFQTGKEIAFYYDPKYPDKPVVDIPPIFSRMLPLIVGFLLIPAGLFIGWVILVNLYSNSKTVDISEMFRIPVRLEYRIHNAAVKILKLPETEQQKLDLYMEYLNSINDYIYNRGNYSSFYTQDRVISEQIKTMERLADITKGDPYNLIRYCNNLYYVLDRNNRLGDASAVIKTIREKYPAQFNDSDLKEKFALDSAGRK